MRKILIPITILLFFTNCDEKKKGITSIDFNQSFTDYKELKFLKDYKKISDTSFIESKSGFESTHRITELKNDNKTLILFNKIFFDDRRNEHYKILDTLEIKNLNDSNYITIGYCSKSDIQPEQIIAMVEKTDKLNVKKIVKVWKANTVSQKIEEINNLQGIECINEFINIDTYIPL